MPRRSDSPTEKIAAEIVRVRSARRELLEILDAGTNGTAEPLSDAEVAEHVAALRASGAWLGELTARLAKGEKLEGLLERIQAVAPRLPAAA